MLTPFLKMTVFTLQDMDFYATARIPFRNNFQSKREGKEARRQNLEKRALLPARLGEAESHPSHLVVKRLCSLF